ncbi:hypothetical protein WA158_006396 [Blastocystis sp. Blastoise]
MQIETEDNCSSKSLGTLAREFLRILDETNGEIDITQFRERMNVAKRRVYDVTSTLEGIGIIRKISRNKYVRIDPNHTHSDDGDSDSEESLYQKKKTLSNEYHKKCKELEELEESNRNLISKNNKYMFLDCTNIYDNPLFKESTVVSLNDTKGSEISLCNDNNSQLFVVDSPYNTLHPQLYKHKNTHIDVYSTNTDQPFDNSSQIPYNNNLLNRNSISYGQDSDSECECTLSDLFLDRS